MMVETSRIDKVAMQGLDPIALGRLRRLGGDLLVREMIDLFLEHTPQRIDSAVAGGKAGNLDMVERAAHALGSSACHLGATALRDAARCLEQAAHEGRGEAILSLIRELEEAFQQARLWMEEERKGLTR